jgi:hypothetical protein
MYPLYLPVCYVVAKLYRADPNPDVWSYTGAWGAVVVMFDRKLEACILRIYDLEVTC